MDVNTPIPVPGDLSLQPDQATIVSVLKNRAILHPVKKAFTFLVDGEDQELSITYGELDTCAGRVARELSCLGFKGKKVLLFYPSGVDFIIAFFGCLLAGVIPVPVFPPRKNRSLLRVHAIVENCGAVSILTTESIAQSLERNFSEDPLLKSLGWNTTEKWSASDRPVSLLPEPGFEDLAFLQYTSGSTGDPKGVMVSHRNIMYNLRSLQLFFQITKDDIAVHWVPQFHDLGLIFGILETVFSGSLTVLISPVNFISKPFCLLRAITRYRATITGQPDFAFNLCVDKTNEAQRSGLDLSSLRIMFSGAEPVRKATFEKFLTAFAPAGLKPEALSPAYGMAESTLILTGKTAFQTPNYLLVGTSFLEKNRVVPVFENDKDSQWITSNGKTNMDTRILITDPETKEILSPEKVGEIWAKGSTITMGYWNQSSLTEKVFCASPAGRNEPAWLRTGDLGFLYKEELFITGRLKDLIIIHGRNFYPQDIELTVEESHSSVRKTCVAAFSIEAKGKERLAVVAEVQKSIFPPDTSEMIEAIVTAISREYEIQPARIVLVRAGSLPKTSSGKMMRRAARQMLLCGEMSIIADRVFEDKEMVPSEFEGLVTITLTEFLISWVSLNLNNGLPANPSNSLASYGMDSLRAVLLTDDTKNMFGFEWPPYLFFEEISIQQLSEEGMKLMEGM
jgi:acyl-CoA synthetase (AMP-forming)/AMP-acid ligase II